MFIIVSVSVLFVFGVTINAQKPSNNPICGDFHPQMMFNFDQILGRWYATEVIFHDKTDDVKIKYDGVCPIVHLSDVLTPTEEYIENISPKTDYKQNTQEDHPNWDELMKPLVKLWHESNQNSSAKYNRRWTPAVQNEELNNFKSQTLQNLRIVWNEQGTRNEYFLKYNISKPGYWMSFGPKNASQPEQHHFVGTVQVLKAVRTHMVLTFCHISFREQFFSVVLTREPLVDEQELHSVYNFLQRKLPVTHIRRMCMDFVRSHASAKVEDVFIIIVGVCLTYFRFVRWYS